MAFVIGIDGGGSTVRAAVVRDDLAVLGESTGTTVNPSIVGHATAQARIEEAVLAALHSAGVDAADIAAIGMGIAGAAHEHSEAWLREIAAALLPDALPVPSNDLEIALVGARGERRGVLLLAGTGSAAYGVNGAGESALVGGWGYLLGDEGSGYWLGREALRLILDADDRHEPLNEVAREVLSSLGLSAPRDLIRWLYRADTARNREIAGIAPLVLAAAERGDAAANRLLDEGAAHLAALARTAAQRVSIETPLYAFAGGLLEQPNALSHRVCSQLGIAGFPRSLYPPVIGAAILALNAVAASSSESP